jgi:hypothetical protein
MLRSCSLYSLREASLTLCLVSILACFFFRFAPNSHTHNEHCGSTLQARTGRGEAGIYQETAMQGKVITIRCKECQKLCHEGSSSLQCSPQLCSHMFPSFRFAYSRLEVTLSFECLEVPTIEKLSSFYINALSTFRPSVTNQ